jgi:hypothetical protein
MAWFAWRLYHQRRLMTIGKAKQGRESSAAAAPGSDSEFFQVERALAKSGLPRGAGESVMEWLARIGPKLPEGVRASSWRHCTTGIGSIRRGWRRQTASVSEPRRSAGWRLMASYRWQNRINRR